MLARRSLLHLLRRSEFMEMIRANLRVRAGPRWIPRVKYGLWTRAMTASRSWTTRVPLLPRLVAQGGVSVNLKLRQRLPLAGTTGCSLQTQVTIAFKSLITPG